MVEKGIITCTCGAEISFDAEDDRVGCGCGANYIVTITQITSPSDD
ncbi:MAG: hypothetical protein ACI8U4_001393 [Natronomonas sp.]|jgi:hypothetical protein